MDLEAAGARIVNLLNTPLVPEPVKDGRINFDQVMEDDGRPKRALSHGEKAIVELAWEVHACNGFMHNLTRVDATKALQVLDVLREEFETRV